MHNAELYSDDATAPNAQAASIPASNNSLENILPNHFNIINSQWLTNFVKWQFSGNQARIIHAIYRHTIGFLKREDDINGARLEQITGIRYDHANEIIRKLAAKNILIVRKGIYGFWTSINFNFSQWNQSDIDVSLDNNDPTQLLPEELRNTPADSGYSLNDNPEQTPVNHQSAIHSNTAPVQKSTQSNTPVKSTENTQIQTKITDNANNSKAIEIQVTPSDLAKVEQNNNDLIKQRVQASTDEILAAQQHLNQELLNIIHEQIGDLGQQVTGSIRSIEKDLNQQIVKSNQQVESFNKLDDKIENLENALERQLQINQQHLEEIKQNNPAQLFDKTEIQDLIKAEISHSQVNAAIPNLAFNIDFNRVNNYIDSDDSEQSYSEEATVYNDYLAQENLTYIAPENSDLSNNTTKKDSSEYNHTETPVLDLKITYKLYFPPKFTPEMCTNINNLCARHKLDKISAETLLNYTEQRRLRDPKEVYNPVGYFAELAMNIENGKLDIQDIKSKISPSLPLKSNLSTVVPTTDKQDLSLYYIRLKELKTAYHHAKDQYSYYESHFYQIAEEENISFDQVVKNEDRQETWKNTVNNLNFTHSAITEYVKDSPI